MTRWTLPATGLALFLGFAAFAQADDPGYFLSWQQKKQLMGLGRIQDASGTWYDVWICPGYAPPGRYAKDHFFAAGRNFREYFEANKYHMLKKGSSACFDWALKECGLGFTVKGIPRAWGRHFSVAQERTERRVFGWWLAYPWAFMEASVETAFRGALGAAGTAGGLASGLAVVPAWHALDSAVAGTWNLGVNTIALPAVGIAWNTAVAPPLALVGQKPAESRVDGFWVTVVASGRTPGDRPPTAAELDLLAQWGALLLRETDSFEKERREIDRQERAQQAEYRRAMKAASQAAEERRMRLHDQEGEKIREVTATNEWARTVALEHPDLRYDVRWHQELAQRLRRQGLSEEEVQRTLEILRTHGDSATPAAVPIRPKTDPVRRGAEVLGESAEDVLKEAFE
ncbi:MAG TPA: hypothetical protein P5204_11035 [Kiritimatiellia bacterium]|nr:hypothetical protein [Kiritimatiellia bacterium]